MLNELWLKFAYWTAGANWLTWRTDFEFVGDVRDLPVLRCEHRFQKFIIGYALLRGCPLEQRIQWRKLLRNLPELVEAVNVDSGSGIESFVQHINLNYEGFRNERSLISKLSAFARPECFNAWDQFSRRGVAILTDGPPNGRYNSYTDYMIAVNNTLNSELGEGISSFLNGKYLPTPNAMAFVRRILDVYLMVQGGRWIAEPERFGQ